MGGLIASGLTAFPLQQEADWLARMLGPSFLGSTALTQWIVHVRDGLTATGAAWPFIAYGTDWLALGHVVIALFFIAPWRDPVRYVANLHVGLVACVLVLPVAFVCGPWRGIPFFWRLIDASFGVFGAVPLACALHWTNRLAGGHR